MKKLRNTETELKKGVAYKKSVYIENISCSVRYVTVSREKPIFKTRF